MTSHPVHNGQDYCSDCGTSIEVHANDARCPACFDRYLYDIDAGFLENYRRFGCRSRLVVAETCLRGLVVAMPDHRKVLAMTIFEQYVLAMNDLAGLYIAFRNHLNAPIVKSFLEFRLDTESAKTFFSSIRSLSDYEIYGVLDLPSPYEVSERLPELSPEDSRQLQIAVYHLVQDLRKTTAQGELTALALSQFSSQVGGAVLASDASWLNGAVSEMTPDQVALLVLDSKRRSIYVQGLTADEGSMGQVVDAIDTVTRAASNLIYAYLQTNDL